MTTESILSALDAEITKLQQVRAMLANVGSEAVPAIKRGPGRPKKALTVAAVKPAK